MSIHSAVLHHASSIFYLIVIVTAFWRTEYPFQSIAHLVYLGESRASLVELRGKELCYLFGEYVQRSHCAASHEQFVSLAGAPSLFAADLALLTRQ